MMRNGRGAMIRWRALAAVVLPLTGLHMFTVPSSAEPAARVQKAAAAGSNGSLFGRLAGPVGLVVGDSAESMLTNMDNVAKLLTSQIIVNRGALTERDPSYLVDRLTAALKRQYPDIRLASTVSESARSGNRSTIVVDVRASLGEMSGQTTAVEINLFAYDAARKLRARVSGRGSSVIPYPAFSYGFQPATDQAIAEIEGKL